MQTIVIKIALFFSLLLLVSIGSAQSVVQIINGGTGCSTASCALNNIAPGISSPATGSLTGTGTSTFNTTGFTQAVAPTAAPIIVSVTSGGSVDIGNHWYVVTFTTAIPPSPSNVDVGETDFSPQSTEATTTSGQQTVNLTIPTGPTGTTGRNIYRVDNQPVAYPFYRKVGSISDNTTTSFADTVPYSSLPSLPNGVQSNPNTTGAWLQVNQLDVGLLSNSDTFFGFCTGGVSRSANANDGASFDNSYFGWGAGCEEAQSYNMAAFGVNALEATVGADDDAAFGVHAGQQCYNCIDLSAFGFGSFEGNAHGQHNAGLGGYSCYQNEGNTNTCVGAFAGSNNILGNGGVYLGFGAGSNETNSNNFYVNNQLESTLSLDKSNSIIYGHMDPNPANQTIQFNVGAGAAIWTGIDWGTLTLGYLHDQYYFYGPGGSFIDGSGNGGFQTVVSNGSVGGSSFKVGTNVVIPTTVTGYDGNASGVKIPLAVAFTGPSGAPACDDGNHNLTESGCQVTVTGTVSSTSGTVTTAHSFGTAFTGTPVCTASPYSSAGTWYFSTLPSSSSTGVITYTTSGAQTFSMQCTGVGGAW